MVVRSRVRDALCHNLGTLMVTSKSLENRVMCRVSS